MVGLLRKLKPWPSGEKVSELIRDTVNLGGLFSYVFLRFIIDLFLFRYIFVDRADLIRLIFKLSPCGCYSYYYFYYCVYGL